MNIKFEFQYQSIIKISRMKKQTPKILFQTSTLRSISIACLYGIAIQCVEAQTTATTTDVLRNIEQNAQGLSRSLPKATAKKVAPPKSSEENITRLTEIRVQSPLFQQELMGYLLSEINKPVSAQRLSEFKAFAWELFLNKGYLAYITTHTQSTSTGSVLTVNVALPKLNKVSVVTTGGGLADEYKDEIVRRFNAAYQAGMHVDVQGFENHLSAASYDLPVDLEISMKQVSATDVDVIIHVRPLDVQPGRILGGVLHANNFGLSQFGRNQLLGNVRVAGLAPSSELTLTTQQSLGVGYYRADYETPITAANTRLRSFASQAKSSATNIEGLSNEVGVGLTTLLKTDRHGRLLAGAEVSRRETQNSSIGVLTSDRIDEQLRLKTKIESSHRWIDNFTNEVILTIGRVDLSRLNSDKLDDDVGLRVAGGYQKIEVSGALSQSLDRERIYTGSIRWKAQAASKNLDNSNRMSLGGITGIRAYSSLDGVGDQGAQMSFDIIHQISPDVYGGLFYDVGMIKNSHTPLSTATDTHSYLLQGAGWQLGGKIQEFNWTLSAAHAFGKTPGPGVWTAVNTTPGDFRVNFSITRPF